MQMKNARLERMHYKSKHRALKKNERQTQEKERRRGKEGEETERGSKTMKILQRQGKRGQETRSRREDSKREQSGHVSHSSSRVEADALGAQITVPAQHTCNSFCWPILPCGTMHGYEFGRGDIDHERKRQLRLLEGPKSTS